MPSDLDIWRTANLLLKQHGEEALAFAAGRAVDYAFAEDKEGAVLWRRILEAVRELQRRDRQDGEALN
jgi:hypothetical protein